MKQPLLPVAIAYALGVVMAAWWTVPLMACLATGFGLLALSLVRPRWRASLLWPLAMITGFSSLTLRTTVLSPHDLRLLAGESAQIATLRGTLVGDPTLREPAAGRDGPPQTVAILEVQELLLNESAFPARGRVVVSTRGQLLTSFHAEGRVQIEGVLSPADGPRAPGLFDYRAYLRWQGIYHQLRVRGPADWQALDPGTVPPLATRFLVWAQKTLARGLPAEDEFLRLLWAMTLGWRTALTDEVAEPFMRTGTMHIFAISGLHIALIAGMLVALLRVLQVPRSACGAVVIPMIWFYTMATGWQASAIRSTIMMTIVVLGWAMRRPADLLNSLVASALVILVWEPRQLFQASFQLSFFVVLSMALLLPPLERLRDRLLHHDPLLPSELLPRWRRWLDPPLRWATLNFGVSLAAWLGSLPLVAHYFHLVTPVSLLVNMVVVPLSSLALMCNLGALAVGAWWPGLAELFNHSAWLWMSGAVHVCDWAAGLPGAWFHAASPGVWGFLGWYALLIWVSGRWLARPMWRWGALGLIGILGAAWLAQGWWERGLATLTVLETRSGGVVWLNPPGHDRDMLVDCGDEAHARLVTKPFLQARGVNRVRHAVFTHGDIRHVGGWRIVDEAFNLRTVGLGPVSFRSPSYRELFTHFRAAGSLRVLAAGTEWSGWRVLHPPASGPSTLADDNCLVLAGEIKGARILLLGDLGPQGQRALAERESSLRADLIISGPPSRGEPIGAALLEAARPHLIILDDAEPAAPLSPPEYVHQWRERGINVLRTAEHGTVTVRFDKAGWEAWGMKAGSIRLATRP